MRVFNGAELLGSVIQTGHYGSTVYRILSNTGNLKFVIKPIEDYVEGIRPSFFQRLHAADDIDIEFPSEFNILSADQSVYIGHITGSWTGHGKGFPADRSMSSDSEEEDETTSLDSSEDINDPTSDENDSDSTSNVSGKSSTSRLSSTKLEINEVDPAETVVASKRKTCVPFRQVEEDAPVIGGTEAELAEALDDLKKFTDQRKQFSRERYERFLEAIEYNNDNWKWYFEGEQFGAEFNSELGSVSRAMLVAVLLLQVTDSVS